MEPRIRFRFSLVWQSIPNYMQAFQRLFACHVVLLLLARFIIFCSLYNMLARHGYVAIQEDKPQFQRTWAVVGMVLQRGKHSS